MPHTLDALTNPDVLALLAAIDAGDDSALPILADLLEEAQDGRAAGLRDIRLGHFWRPWEADGRWCWLHPSGVVAGNEHPAIQAAVLTVSIFRRLPATGGMGETTWGCGARSAAMLALAEALA